jgi:phage-related protein
MAYNGCMPPPDKSIVWLKGHVTTPPFSARARMLVGHLLRRLQRRETLTMPDSRPMPAVDPGCHELRVREMDHFWRLMYFIGPEEIVVLEV